MRLLALISTLAIASVQPSIAEEKAGSTKWLYDACKQVEQSNEGETLSTENMNAALKCMYYMAGAFQGYNWATASECNLARKNPEALIKIFLHVYRTSPQQIGDLPAEAFVGTVLDVCFCGKDKDLENVMCPALPPH